MLVVEGDEFVGVFLVPAGDKVGAGLADALAVEDGAAESAGDVDAVMKRRVWAEDDREGSIEIDAGREGAQAFDLDSTVGDFGAMIRSSYDLFRLDLLSQYRIKHPKNSIEEFEVWKNLGELTILGQASMYFKPLRYDIKNNKKNKS